MISEKDRKYCWENYSFDVIDLGKDVAPELILQTAKEQEVRLVGLSALMTTTVASMEETIRLLKKELPECKIMVGGAVLNQEYADMIGPDFYGKDAMKSVYYAQELFTERKQEENKMRGLQTPVRQIRRQVFTKVAELGFKGNAETLLDDMEAIPYEIVNDDTEKYRESTYRSRAIVRERLRLAMGLSLRPENKPVHLMSVGGK